MKDCINRIRLEFKVKGDWWAVFLTVVLIESDWNLKTYTEPSADDMTFCINRIRLEFKVFKSAFVWSRSFSINRIRLEFKVRSMFFSFSAYSVLIESDWNLKETCFKRIWYNTSINRIRLEFKGHLQSVLLLPEKRINRIRLEFKVKEKAYRKMLEESY